MDGGRLVVALGAILLLVALFLDWYGSGRGGFGDEAISAWTAFEIVDLLLALLAIAAIVGALEPLARGTSRVPESAGAVAGPAALVLVLVSIINKPPLLQVADIDLEVGAWLALAGAAIMCAGALLALNRVSLVVTTRAASPRTPGHRPAPPIERAAPAPGEDTRASETQTRPL